LHITPNRNQLPDSRAFSCAQARLKPVRKIFGPGLGFACVWLWADRAMQAIAPRFRPRWSKCRKRGRPRPLITVWTICQIYGDLAKKTGG
jgi:hypothetical protein